MIVDFFHCIHLVGSGRLGFSTTSAWDCNTYVLSARDDAVLIDAGCGLACDLILENIAAVGGPPVSRILLTHAHADHAAGAGELAEALGAEVWASPEVATIVENGDEMAAGLSIAKRAGVYPEPVSLRPTHVARRVNAGQERVGGVAIEVIETPGHAHGHLCFLAELAGCRALFSGDVVFSRGRVVVLATPDSDIAALAGSVRLLAEAEPDALFPGHCEPVLTGATIHVEAAQQCFERGTIPPALT